MSPSTIATKKVKKKGRRKKENDNVATTEAAMKFSFFS